VQTKLSKEFTNAITAFQRVQRASAEKQRSTVESQKRTVDRMVEDDGWINTAVPDKIEGWYNSIVAGDERGSVELGTVQRQELVQQQQ
jgi:hypothetical protein